MDLKTNVESKRTIRKAELSELAAIMQVIEAARGNMRASGNMRQWNHGYPSEEVITADLEKASYPGSRHIFRDIMAFCLLRDGNIRISTFQDNTIIQRLRRLITSYLDTESTLLTAEHSNHNISSDIIESDFGIFKDSMPSNKTNGFTESILYILLRPKACNPEDAAKIDIKTIMERRNVKEVKQWKTEHLKANPMSKRRYLLVA